MRTLTIGVALLGSRVAGETLEWSSATPDAFEAATSSLTFAWSGAHDVYRLADAAAFAACDFAGATLVGASSPATAGRAGAVEYFACSRGGHCAAGMRVAVSWPSPLAAFAWTPSASPDDARVVAGDSTTECTLDSVYEFDADDVFGDVALAVLRKSEDDDYQCWWPSWGYNSADYPVTLGAVASTNRAVVETYAAFGAEINAAPATPAREV